MTEWLLVQTLYSKWEEEGAAWVQMQPSARFGDTDIIPSRSVRLSPEQLSLIDRHFDEVRVLAMPRLTLPCATAPIFWMPCICHLCVSLHCQWEHYPPQ